MNQNKKARKDLCDNNLQSYLLSSSLHLSNSLLVVKACPSFNNADSTKTNTPTNRVIINYQHIYIYIGIILNYRVLVQAIVYLGWAQWCLSPIFSTYKF